MTDGMGSAPGANAADGPAEALRRIAACRETRAETLDLGGLRLEDLPDELLELGWLKRLYLGGDAEMRALPPESRYFVDRKKCNALRALLRASAEALAQV